MTDSDIIKALEKCIYGTSCRDCPCNDDRNKITGICERDLKALDLLKRQQAEIEQLKAEKDNLSRNYKECAMEILKSAVEQLKGRFKDVLVSGSEIATVFDQIIAEMEGEK